jgi:streptomycin 6-kinase
MPQQMQKVHQDLNKDISEAAIDVGAQNILCGTVLIHQSALHQEVLHRSNILHIQRHGWLIRAQPIT